MSLKDSHRFLITASHALIGATLAVYCAACTGGGKPPLDSLQKNTRPFQFNYEQVTEIMMVKADPVTGDRWTARVTRSATDPLDWRIQSDAAGGVLLDRRADGALIRHLLDTFRTLQVSETSIAGPLESLGLAPPRFAVKWKTADQKQFEVRIGGPAKEPKNAYSWTTGQAPFVSSGAALDMLEHFDSFAAIRLKTWAGISTDEIDEVELFNGKRSIFYAQREGSDWTRRNHKPLGRDLTDWLEKITHSRVLHFIDDTELAEQARAQVIKAPVATAVFTDRHGVGIRLQIGWAKLTEGRRLIGISSARDGVFEIYPVAASLLTPPKL